MKLAGQRVVLFLSEEGEAFFHKVANVRSLSPVIAEVVETDDLGIWVRARQKAPEWVLLLRWEYVLGIEVQEEKSKVIGLRG
jgi:hypothetical protein